MDTSHVRVRVLRDGINDGAMNVYCSKCHADATLLMPMNADDLTEMLAAFIDHHERCKKDGE